MRQATFLKIAGAIALSCAGGTAQAASLLYGLTRADSGRNLVSFSSETPGAFDSVVPLTGDVNRQVLFLSLDLNSSNGVLYAIAQTASGHALYSIGYDGVAKKVGTGLGLNIGSQNAGLEYDAASGNFLVVTNTEKMYRVDPVTGLATASGSFGYVSGDPFGQLNPNVIAAGIGAQTYVLDKNGPGNGGLLSTLNGSTLSSVAPVSQLLDTNASFDIAPNGEAYFDSGRVSDRLFLLNLTDGSVTDKGALQMQLTGLTAGMGMVSGVPEPGTWAMMLVGFGSIGFAMRRRKVTTRVRFA